MLLATDISKIQKFLSTQPVRKAFVFGSVARGEETSSSDIDLLIELDRSERVGLIKFTSIKLGLETVLNKKIDLLSVGGVSAHLLPIIEKEKKLVYEK